MSEVAVIVNVVEGDVNFSIMNIEVFRWYEAIRDGARVKASEDIMDLLSLDEDEMDAVLEELQDNSDFVPEALIEETFDNMLEVFEHVADNGLVVTAALHVCEY